MLLILMFLINVVLQPRRHSRGHGIVVFNDMKGSSRKGVYFI